MGVATENSSREQNETREEKIREIRADLEDAGYPDILTESQLETLAVVFSEPDVRPLSRLADMYSSVSLGQIYSSKHIYDIVTADDMVSEFGNLGVKTQKSILALATYPDESFERLSSYYGFSNSLLEKSKRQYFPLIEEFQKNGIPDSFPNIYPLRGDFESVPNSEDALEPSSTTEKLENEEIEEQPKAALRVGDEDYHVLNEDGDIYCHDEGDSDFVFIDEDDAANAGFTICEECRISRRADNENPEKLRSGIRESLGISGGEGKFNPVELTLILEKLDASDELTDTRFVDVR